MDILKYLDSSKIVKDFSVIDFRRWDRGKYLNLIIEFIDDSVLYIKEYQDEVERNYSYHWQNKDKEMLIRWDNSPHYPEHKSFPHHKHLPDQITESNEISLKEVIKFLERQIKSQEDR